jgi:hypothetical protein
MCSQQSCRRIPRSTALGEALSRLHGAANPEMPGVSFGYARYCGLRVF